MCSIEESKDIDLLTIDQLQSSLLVHEQKFRKARGDEQALKVLYEDGTGGRRRAQGGFRGSGVMRGRGRGRGLNRTTIECFKCHQLGHFRYECPKCEKAANYTEIDEEK